MDNAITSGRLLVLPNDQIRATRIRWRAQPGTGQLSSAPEVPFASAEAFVEMRKAKVSACADVVVGALHPDGYPVFALSRRRMGVCFGGKLWIHGGSVTHGDPAIDFVRRRAQKELGVLPFIEAPLGVWRTAWIDETGRGETADTINVCYVGSVPYEALMDSAHTDTDHDEVRVISRGQYANIQEGLRHWYIKDVLDLAHNTWPSR